MKILRSFQLNKSWIPCSRLDGLVKRPDALLSREDFDSLACIRPDVRATLSGCSSMLEKNLDFLCKHGSGKTTCNRSDARATSSECDLNKETREAYYGKAIAQFTDRTLYADARTPPKNSNSVLK